MSNAVIRKLLQAHLMTGAPGDVLPTAWEGVAFTPTAGQAYQKPYLLPARTRNPTMGDGFKREVGLFQISLGYPDGAGTGGIESKAASLCAHFARGLVLEDGLVRVRVDESAYASRVDTGNGWLQLAVSVPYEADVFN